MNYAPALAQNVADQGRGRDTMLVHMTPREVAGLQALARAKGGSLTINPNTGLPEAGFLEDLLPVVLGGLAGSSGLGEAVGNLFGLGKEVGSGLLVGGLTALSSGSLSKGLMAGIGAYGGAGLAGMMFTPEQALGGAGNATAWNTQPSAASAVPEISPAQTADTVGGTYSDMYKRAVSQPTMESFNTSALTNPVIQTPVEPTVQPTVAQPPAYDASGAPDMRPGRDVVPAAPTPSPLAKLMTKEGMKYGLAALTPAMSGTSAKPVAVDKGTPAMIRPYKLTRQYLGGQRPEGTGETGERLWYKDVWEKQEPYKAAHGGAISMADGGVPMDKMAPEDDADPFARYNRMTGGSRRAWDYLMGRAPTYTPPPSVISPIEGSPVVPPAPAPAPTAPVAPKPVQTGGGGVRPGSVDEMGNVTPLIDPRTEAFMNAETKEQRAARMGEINNLLSWGPRLIPGAAVANWAAEKATGKSYLPDARMPNLGVLAGVGAAYNRLSAPPETGTGWTGGTYVSPTGEVSYVSPSVAGGGGGAAGAKAALSDITGYNPSGFVTSRGDGRGDAGDAGRADSDSMGSDSVDSWGGWSTSEGGGFAGGGYLKQGGFVVPADVVSALGNGSSEAGLRALNKRLNARPIKGPGDGMSDSIPTKIEGGPDARVANDEAYIDAEDVAKLGGGDPKKGAKKLYALMDRIRKSAHGKTTQQRKVNADSLLA